MSRASTSFAGKNFLGVTEFRASGRDVPYQARQAAPRDLLGDLLHLVEAKPHFLMDLIHTAATNGVMRVVLEQQVPGVTHKGMVELVGGDIDRFIGSRIHPRCKGAERFRPTLQQSLTSPVALLYPHAGRQHTGDDAGALWAPELTLNRLQGGIRGAHGGDVLGQGAVYEFQVRQTLFRSVHEARQASEGLRVVHAVHQEDGVGGGVRGQAIHRLAHSLGEAIRVAGRPGQVAIAVAHVYGQDSRSVRRLPQELRRQVRHAAPDGRVTDAEAG